ncbi:hypothetical protein Hanom_Chr09g00808291 [Helianthus anomalus]
MLHDWMYTAERLPLVKEAYKKYRVTVQAKQQRIAQAEEEAAETEEERLKRKRKGKQKADDEPSKKKRSSKNPERLMGASFRAAESEEHRQHIQDMLKIHEMEEKEKREKRLKRREMSESKRPAVVTEEEQTLDDFVDTLITDPDEISASKLTPPKKKSTDEGPSRFPQVKPRISKPLVPPQRVRPFQDLHDKLVKEIGPISAKKICLLKNQVNDTNILREKLQDQRKKNKEMMLM